MKYWTTRIHAIDPMDGKIKLWMGPNVPGETKQQAINFCQQNGLGYCMPHQELVMEINDKPRYSLN